MAGLRIALCILFALFTVLASTSMLVPIYRKDKDNVTKTIYYSCLKTKENGKTRSQRIYDLDCDSARLLHIFSLYSNAIGTASSAMSCLISIIYLCVRFRVWIARVVVLFSTLSFLLFTICSACMLYMFYAPMCQDTMHEQFSFENSDYKYDSGFYMMLMVSIGSVIVLVMGAYLSDMHSFEKEDNANYELEECQYSCGSTYCPEGSFRGNEWEYSEDEVMRF
ncbi:unnamed protein product [Phytomonas sp. EM1]|nr:unnamed protein product [Phytomonas sp. EM1]|eukprot:CCW61203.1 unnamed protein product [Phytomonas sp. isolate EM1]